MDLDLKSCLNIVHALHARTVVVQWVKVLFNPNITSNTLHTEPRPGPADHFALSRARPSWAAKVRPTQENEEQAQNGKDVWLLTEGTFGSYPILLNWESSSSCLNEER